MADQDYPQLYEDLEVAAVRTRNAAIAFETMLGGAETVSVPVHGFPAQPTVAKRVKDAVAVAVGTTPMGDLQLSLHYILEGNP